MICGQRSQSHYLRTRKRPQERLRRLKGIWRNDSDVDRSVIHNHCFMICYKRIWRSISRLTEPRLVFCFVFVLFCFFLHGNRFMRNILYEWPFTASGSDADGRQRTEFYAMPASDCYHQMTSGNRVRRKMMKTKGIIVFCVKSAPGAFEIRINKNNRVHKMGLPRRHFLFVFFHRMDGKTDGQTFWCHPWIVLNCLLVAIKFCHHQSIGNDVFSHSKIRRDRRTDRQMDQQTDGPTDRQTEGQTQPLIEMRSRI